MADHPEFSGQAVDPENPDSPFRNSSLHNGTTQYAKHHRALARGPKLARVTIPAPITVGGYDDTDNVAVGGLQHDIPAGAHIISIGVYGESRNAGDNVVQAAFHTVDDPQDLQGYKGLDLEASGSWTPNGAGDVDPGTVAVVPLTFSLLASSATDEDTVELRNLSAWCHYIDP